MKTIKNRIIHALDETNRLGMEKMIDWLNGEGFFTSPASTRFHGCYPGGLAQHSWDVFQNMEGIMAGLEGIERYAHAGPGGRTHLFFDQGAIYLAGHAAVAEALLHTQPASGSRLHGATPFGDSVGGVMPSATSPMPRPSSVSRVGRPVARSHPRKS